MALLGFLKKSNKSIKFRDKDTAYRIEESDVFFHIILGIDGKLRNAWNDIVYLKLTFNKQNKAITFYVVKNDAGINDSKPIYSSTGSAVHAETFQLEDSEIKQLTDFLYENMK